ncbi:MAG TPA: hypothetical protein VHF92_19470 [Geodermatophilus sp.]|nr:hypothetical protein [Geodermatophilus sp.]
MTYPGPDANTSGQPGPTAGGWNPPAPAGGPAQGAWNAPAQGAWNAPAPGGAPQAGWGSPAGAPAPSSGKKWAGIAGTVAAVGVAGLVALGGFGLGDPEIGDCVKTTGATSFEAVDCDDSTAEARIVGVEGEEQTYAAFQADPDSCVEFPTATLALWIGAEVTEDGTIYCAEPV